MLVNKTSGDGKFHIEFDGTDKTGQVSVLSTGSYSNFATKKITGIALKKGVQVMRIYFDYAEYNMGSISVTNEISAGMIQSEYSGKLIIYPTPVHDNLFISGINTLERYTILDVYGQVLLEGNIANNEFINVISLQSGNYLIKFKSINEVQTKIFIKL